MTEGRRDPDAPLPVGKLPGDLLAGLLAGIEAGDDVLVGPGIGRDAAAVRVGDQILVMKTDPITFPTADVGWYLVNINANDIACMGAVPRWLLVTALLPEASTTPALVESIFAGLRNACADVGCSLIGGHTEITEGLDRPLLIGQMIGVTTQDELIDPSTAQPGDAVMLIGGIAIEGTAILASEASDRLSETVDALTLQRGASFDRAPGISVLNHAINLRGAAPGQIKAMHDPTEGGLATGLDEIAQATGLGIEIEAEMVHVYEETRAITSALSLDPWGLIASGALLAVVSPDHASALCDRFDTTERPVRQIGRLTANPDERILIKNGEPRKIPEFAVDEIARFFAGR
ncbi:MAG: hydrogenase expression protein [Sphaerobacteraceae bacterium]|nr:MAG: hydrogenase expression protein [Sphaerobacteraceae bacterium]